jgi:hypothetical protein
MRRPLVWTLVVVLYAAFFGWYTSCAGPLTPEEIDRYVAAMEQRGAPAERIALMRAFLEADTGDDFVMVNVIEFREPPERVEGVGPNETASDVMARYMEYMWPALLKRACHPVLMGQAAAPALDLWGIEGAERWDQAGLMRYRSRRDMLEIAGNPAFQGPHEFKIAAMTKTIAFPADPWFQLGDPRLVLGLVLLVVGLALGGRGR